MKTLQQNTSWQEASDTINANNQEIDVHLKSLDARLEKNKGLFKTLAELQAKYPTASEGDYAYIGAAIPAPMYTWNGASWVATGEEGGATNIYQNEVVQEMGDSDSAVMSQKAVTAIIQEITNPFPAWLNKTTYQPVLDGLDIQKNRLINNTMMNIPTFVIEGWDNSLELKIMEIGIIPSTCLFYLAWRDKGTTEWTTGVRKTGGSPTAASFFFKEAFEYAINGVNYNIFIDPSKWIEILPTTEANNLLAQPGANQDFLTLTDSIVNVMPKEEVMHQESGQDAENPMSQKAVTDYVGSTITAVEDNLQEQINELKSGGGDIPTVGDFPYWLDKEIYDAKVLPKVAQGDDKYTRMHTWMSNLGHFSIIGWDYSVDLKINETGCLNDAAFFQLAWRATSADEWTVGERKQGKISLNFFDSFAYTINGVSYEMRIEVDKALTHLVDYDGNLLVQPGIANDLFLVTDKVLNRLPTAEESGLAQELGESTEVAMSQKAVTTEIARLDARIDNTPSGGVPTEEINLNNVPYFLVSGSSYAEGAGSLKGKNFIHMLSAFLDWNVENYSKSGETFISMFDFANSDSVLNGTVHPSQLNGGKVFTLLGGNDLTYRDNDIDGKYFELNIKKYITLMRSFGFEPILGSYAGAEREPWGMVEAKVAEDMNCLWLDTNASTERMYKNIYLPWWVNAHFATRTNVLQWYNYISMLKGIERPRTGIKIFRNRVNYTNISELLFDNYEQKLQRWQEIMFDQKCIRTDLEKYVDRMDLIFNEGSYYWDTTNPVVSEYNKLRKGQSVTMPNATLMQIVFPATEGNISNPKLYLDTDKAISTYIRIYKDASLDIDLSGSGALFITVSPTPNIGIGSVWTDGLNAGVTYTVTLLDGNKVFATPSGSFDSPGLVNGTLTKVSGSGDATVAISQIGKTPPADYFDVIGNPNGIWKPLTKVDDYYDIAEHSNYLDYDRADILIIGDNYTITNPRVVIDKPIAEKLPIERGVKVQRLKAQEEQQLFASTNFNEGTGWSLSGDFELWDGNVTYTDKNGAEQTQNHIPLFYQSETSDSGSNGINKILRLNEGASASINVAKALGLEGYNTRYKLVVTARYYPTEALDIENLPADVRTPSTFDLAEFEVRVPLSHVDTRYWSSTCYAPMEWVEIEIPMHFNGRYLDASNLFKITSKSDNLEILKVELMQY